MDTNEKKVKIIQAVAKFEQSIVAVMLSDYSWEKKEVVIENIISGEINYITSKKAEVITYDDDTKIRTKDDTSEDNNLGNLPDRSFFWRLTVVQEAYKNK